MTEAGPPLERLMRRVGETPAEFMAEPRIGAGGTVAVAALVNDVLARFGGREGEAVLHRFVSEDRQRDRNRLALAMIAAWLVTDEWFLAATSSNAAVLAVLDATVDALSQAAPAHMFVTDDERREELARTTIGVFGFRPAGETAAQAADRLSAVSATERQRLLRASRAAEARARAVREALIRKAAAEAADKWTRE